MIYSKHVDNNVLTFYYCGFNYVLEKGIPTNMFSNTSLVVRKYSNLYIYKYITFKYIVTYKCIN